MPGVFIGSAEIGGSEIYLGSTPIQEVYLGATKVWPVIVPPLFHDPSPITNTSQWTWQGNVFPFQSNTVSLVATINSSSSDWVYSKPFNVVSGVQYRLSFNLQATFAGLTVQMVQGAGNTSRVTLELAATAGLKSYLWTPTITESIRIRLEPRLWGAYPNTYRFTDVLFEAT